MRSCVWSRNLVNEGALARVGAAAPQGGKNSIDIQSNRIFKDQCVFSVPFPGINLESEYILILLDKTTQISNPFLFVTSDLESVYTTHNMQIS